MGFFAAVIDGSFLQWLLLLIFSFVDLLLVGGFRVLFVLLLAFRILRTVSLVLLRFRILLLLSFSVLAAVIGVCHFQKRLIGHSVCSTGVFLVLVFVKFDTLEVLLHEPEADVLNFFGPAHRRGLDSVARLSVVLGTLALRGHDFASALHLVDFLLLLKQGLLLLLEQLLFLRFGHRLTAN